MNGLNRQERKYIATLQRRMGHLKKRIDASPEKKLGYDIQEHNALRWATEKIMELNKPKAYHDVEEFYKDDEE